MKIKNTDSLAVVSTACVFFIWLGLTGFFLWGFSDILGFSLLFSVLGSTTFEAFHLWSMIKLKTFWNDKKKRLPYLIMFIIMASVTIFAAVSFAGRVVSIHQVKVLNSNQELISLNSKIVNLNSTINTMQKRVDFLATDTNYISTYNKAYTSLTNFQGILNDAELKYNTLKNDTNKIEKKESISAFEFYSNTTKLPINIIVVLFMILFFSGLEYGYFLTCPTEEKPSLVIDERENIIKYIDALMDIQDGKVRLNSNDKISDLTMIPLTECKRIKDMLSGKDVENAITWRTPKGEKVNLITVKQGGTKANFTKENMKIIVNNKANLS